MKAIFNYIQGLNPITSEISSIGGFVTDHHRSAAENVRKELLKVVPAASLAYQILCDTTRFTEKQLWVITYELAKNPEFVKSVENYDPRTITHRVKDREQAESRAIATDFNIVLKAEIKEAGKLIKDYLNFLKTGSKELKKEYYSKKYSRESLTQFLSI